MSKIHLTINGQVLEAESGDTILQAAQRGDIRIPTLCHHPALPPEESCRICVVEMIRGQWSSLVAACVYPAREGMVIETDTEQVVTARKTILELILSDHPLDCMTCNATGRCELQDLAYEYGIKESTLTGQVHVYPLDPDPNLYIHWDMNKCIMCRRCIRACSEIQCAHVLTKADRGFNQRISTAFGRPLEQSGCDFDGQCIAFCPVDALSEKMSRGKGRTWEMVRHPVVCPLCACGCLNDLNRKGTEVIKITSNFSSPANQGALCFRGRFRYSYLNKPERLKTPLLKKGNDWVETGWPEALEIMAEKIKTTQGQFGPQSLGFLLGPTLTNEELYLWKRLAREGLKTEKTTVAGSSVWAPVYKILEDRLGYAGASNPTGDLRNSAGILVIGSHLLESHPIVGIQIRQAVQKGAALMILEDKPGKLNPLARIALTVPPPQEGLLVQGLVAGILQQNRQDSSYLESRASGLKELRESLTAVTLASVSAGTGLAVPALEEALAFVTDHRPLAVVCPPPSEPGEPFSPFLAEGLINLQLLLGNLGKAGGGLYLLPPQANSLGAWALGISRPDYTEKDLLAEVASQTIRGLILVAEDPQGFGHLSADQVKQLAPLQADGFLIVQDLFLSPAAQQADLVLPARPYSEKTGTLMNLERRLQLSRGADPGPKAVLWTGDLLAGLARHLGLPALPTTPDQTFMEITRTHPDWAGFSYARIEDGGRHWPCPSPDHPGTPILFEDGFPQGKAKLFSA